MDRAVQVLIQNRYLLKKDTIMKLLGLFLKDENGGGMIEYVLIVALIALAAVAAITTVGTKITTNFTSVSSKL
jgi:pilus assembly protein Flp/PilA